MAERPERGRRKIARVEEPAGRIARRGEVLRAQARLSGDLAGRVPNLDQQHLLDRSQVPAVAGDDDSARLRKRAQQAFRAVALAAEMGAGSRDEVESRA